jgi:hypothetical protein
VSDFYDVLAEVTQLLQREGRASYRALKRQSNLDDAYLEDLKEDHLAEKILTSRSALEGERKNVKPRAWGFGALTPQKDLAFKSDWGTDP